MKRHARSPILSRRRPSTIAAIPFAPFTTREVAIGVWGVVFFGWAATYPAVRSSFYHLVRSVLRPKLLLTYCAVTCYAAAATWLLYGIGLWTVELLKDTILWFLFAGLALAFSGAASGKEFSWTTIVTGQLKVVIVVEWIVNTYSLSLATELVIIPLLAVVAILDAVARTRDEYAPAAKITGTIQVMIGLAVLGYAIRQAFLHHDPGTLHRALRSLAIAPILSICIVPLAYLLALASAYENLFLQSKFGDERDRGVIRYLQWRMMRKLGWRIREVRSFARQYAPALLNLRSRADADTLIAAYTQNEQPPA